MEAPDKIYINGFSAFATVPVKEGIEYIRKEALMVWLEKANEQALIEQGEYNTGTTIWEEVIDKINSL